MRRASFVLLLAAGCRYTDAALVTRVESSTAGIQQLRIDLTYGALRDQVRVPDPASAAFRLPTTFVLKLPADTHGAVGLAVDGLDGAGRASASGRATVAVDGAGEYAARVVLGAGSVDGGVDLACADLASCACLGCPTAVCCGGHCQVQHQNGLGQSFYHCAPFGERSSELATAACQAWSARASGCEITAPCAGALCANAEGGGCACWVYDGASAGHVRQAATCQCPLDGDPAWN